jgi:DNA-binding response OmpR family regulator
MPRRLVIDDEALATTLVRGLAYEGFDVDVAATGPAGLAPHLPAESHELSQKEA